MFVNGLAPLLTNFLLFCFFTGIIFAHQSSDRYNYDIVTADELCAVPISSVSGRRMVSLGWSNGALVHLSRSVVDPYYKSTVGPDHACVLDIDIPRGHVLSVDVQWTRRSTARRVQRHQPGPQLPECPLAVFTPGPLSRPLWSVDLCAPRGGSSPRLVFADLTKYKPRLTVVWTPPPNNGSMPRAKQLVLSAVAKGPTRCLSGGSGGSAPFACWRPPAKSHLCIPRAAVCDGRRNCPLGDDEFPELCRLRFFGGGETRRVEEGDLIKPYEKPWDTSGPLSAQLIREIVARELRQELEEASAADLHFRLQSIFSPKASNASSQEPDHAQGETFADGLSHYGPWGYLILGLIICGMMLLLCGLWECCCRRPKTVDLTPEGSPSAVFVIGPETGTSPPSYDDLEQPPTYTSLFPTNSAPGATTTVILVDTSPCEKPSE